MFAPDLKAQFQGPFTLSKRRLLFVAAAFLTTTVALFISWPKLADAVLSSAYMPHLYCYLGSTALAWTHVIADSLIGLAYLAISLTLVYLIYRGKSDVPFQGMFLAFGLFIIACGSSHFMEAITVWIPVYCTVSNDQSRDRISIGRNRSLVSIRGS